MNDTIATPITTISTEHSPSAPKAGVSPGQSTWRGLLATLGHPSLQGLIVAIRKARGSFSRHWILTACACSLAFLILAPVLRRAKEQFASRPSVGTALQSPVYPSPITRRKNAVGRELLTPAASSATSPVDTLQDSAVVETQEAEEGTSGSTPGFQWSAPMIARTVSISLVAKDFSSSRAALEAILARHHGYAASLTANTQQNAARSLQASLRIPAPELGVALDELKSLGQVQNENQSGEEVTQQHADLVARLKNSRETERRLQAILEQRTGKISDVLAVEQEIARVRGEIEQMEAEQKSLEHRVDFATIDLSVLEEYKAQIGSPSPSFSTRLHNALVGGYRDALETLAGIVLFFAADGPSIFLWLAFLLPIMWLLRRRWLREHPAVSPAGV
jgi:hypothetical protein